MRNKNNRSIKSNESAFQTATVLGQFEGECADATITNKNGLDITQEVWENVFNSDDYKQAIDLKWYIGFLGHPEDPNCMDFEHACIVMTEGHIDPDGKVYGKFDLVDTPVGRIVKSFIDAGVTFGISVRGAGDIIDNSVDPDTFVFRGFDLVTFPAYPEAIPTFTQIAASSDVDKQRKYQTVCAAVRNNIEGLNTCEAVEIVQSQFAKQSDEYKMLEDRKSEIESDDALDYDITSEKLNAVTELYLSTKTELDSVKASVKILKSQLKHNSIAASRKIAAIQRITASQTQDLQEELFNVTHKYQTIKASTRRVKQNVLTMKEELDTLKNSNLKYKQKIEATTCDNDKKNSIISELRSELNETVTAATEAEAQTSNRDATIKKLRQEVAAATKLIEDYQQAYANIYANALGVHLEDMRVTSSTTVNELKTMISSASSNSTSTQSLAEPTPVGDIIDDSDDINLVTM